MYTLGDRPSAGPRGAFLVGTSLGGEPVAVVEEHLDELAELVTSCEGHVLGRAMQRRPLPDAATFIGKGKAAEIAATARELGAEILVFDDDLSPGQVKNLEKIFELPVMDRSSLILEIFSRRARSSEARTQVELARLRYLLPRLTRMWGHLSRQVGGIGVRGGTGETQLEADRRVLRQRIRKLERELAKVETSRDVQRRRRSQQPVVALAGYTNAGKSTLFERLTRSGTRGEDKLFATLDARMRRGSVGPQAMVVFADTVGFIRKLPHHLVSSFRSTLGEITEADLVVHVVDRSHPAWRDQESVATEVLEELGVSRDRTIVVYNKVDRLAERLEPLDPGAIPLSALTGEGVADLKRELCARLFPDVASAGGDAGAAVDTA